MTPPGGTRARSVVTPGNHDGVHLGHRSLLRAAGERAASERATGAMRVVALTFDPHPATILAPERAPEMLTTIARRTELLRAFGADHVEAQRFDADFAQLEPEAFARTVLHDRLASASVVVGPDFRFGRRRAGDLETLRALGRQLDFDVIAVDPVLVDGEIVSSTAVRAALREGDVARASRLLGRIHDVDGEIVRGDQRGRTIGFPTANFSCDPVMLPADGVYAVVARRLDGRIDGTAQEILLGVANSGLRPTVGAGRSLEAHFFDFDGDLYGARVRLGFVERLRGEQKLASLDALRSQIARDAASARAGLAACDRALWQWI